MRIKRILVPIDFSAASLRALDEAVVLARSLNARLSAVFVLGPLHYPYTIEFMGSAVGLGLIVDAQRKWALQEMAKLVARLAKRGVKCNALIEHGTPHERIVETARRVRANLIVMSTHGRTGLSHVMLGSVAERVVRTAPCSVLIVPGEARKRRTSRRVEGKTSAKAA
jgi:nucleotide-binding universal stress UspA family protein